MKKKFANVLMAALLLLPVSANAINYNEYTPERIQIEYSIAQEKGDIQKMEDLESIARIQLDELVEEVNSIKKSRGNYDPDLENSYREYFKSGRWINREMWALSLNPKKVPTTSRQKAVAWDSVTYKHSDDRNWNYRNINIMKEQFLCHVRYGLAKTPWNIEPDKTSINPVTCN